MGGHYVHRQRRVRIAVELGPVERENHLAAAAEHEARPRRGHLLDVDAAIAQEAIGLLDAVLRPKFGDLGVRRTDRVDRDPRRLHRPDRGVGQRVEPLGVEVLEDRAEHLSRADEADLRNSGPSASSVGVGHARPTGRDRSGFLQLIDFGGVRNYDRLHASNEGIPQVPQSSAA